MKQTIDEVAEQLFLSLRSYPCRCVYERTGVRPMWGKDGNRILESRCSRCVALDAYERAVDGAVP